MFEKSPTKLKLNLLRCKNIVNIAIYNISKLNSSNQLPEFKASAAE